FVSKLSADGSSLLYSAFVGGGTAYGLALNADGSAYIAGSAFGDFPVTQGVFQTDPHGGFVAKLSPAGDALEYATYLGGSSLTEVFAIAVDGSGNAYVTGVTRSTDFPTQNAWQASSTDGYYDDAFVTKLNPSGSALVYSTCLGGDWYDVGYGIAVDESG